MLTDLLTYLPDDILTKVDRAAMAVSLETRIPFLDPQVVEFAARLPISRKIHNGESKQILRELLYQYLPRGLVDRPKMGFSIPVDDWLRGPLRDWAEALLEEQKIEQAGYLDSKIIRQKFKEHLSGECNWQYSLWNVLMFQAWNEQYK